MCRGDEGRRLKPTLLDGDDEKNEVAMVAKYWGECRVGLGAQAGMPVLLKGDGEVEHLGANGTEGPFLALLVGVRLKHA